MKQVIVWYGLVPVYQKRILNIIVKIILKY